jgi:hypothetical protein
MVAVRNTAPRSEKFSRERLKNDSYEWAGTPRAALDRCWPVASKDLLFAHQSLLEL